MGSRFHQLSNFSVREAARDALPLVLCLTLTVATAGIGLVAWDVHKLIYDARATSADLRGTISRANQAIGQVQAAVDGEQKYYDQATRQMAGSFKALRLLLDRTDMQLNDAGGVLPRLTESIDRFNSDADRLTRHTDNALDQITAHSAKTFDGFSKASADLDALMVDPHTRATIANLDGMTGHLNQISGDGAAFIHRATAPPTLKQKIFNGTQEVGGLTYLIWKLISLRP